MTENGNFLGGVGIEIVRGCNFRCRMCPSAQAHPGPLDYMTRDTAHRIVERLNEVDEIASIWTFGMGEPLAHPEVYEMFRILNGIRRSKDTPVILYTNGSLLSGEAAYALLELPYVTQLYISFDGYGTKESYDYLRGDHFHEVIDNVRNFMILAARKRPGLFVGTSSIYPEPKFMPGGQTFTHEEAETKMRQIFEPMGVHVGMRPLHKYNGFYVPALYKNIDADELPRLRVMGGCRYLDEQSFEIAWDGKVRPCRDVVNEDFVIGDLMKEPIRDIVRGERFLRLRHRLRLDQRHAYAECANCDKFSFGDDAAAAAAYWKARMEAGEITDREEREYLGQLVQLGESRK